MDLKFRLHKKDQKNRTANTVHIAGRGLVVRQLRILASQFHVLRTGTLSGICPDNMYQPLNQYFTPSTKFTFRLQIRTLFHSIFKTSLRYGLINEENKRDHRAE